MPLPPDVRAHCLSVLDAALHPDHNNKTFLFWEPVDTSFFPDYAEFVSNPIDLKTLRARLEDDNDNTYNNAEDVWRELECMATNCKTYQNRPTNPYPPKQKNGLIKVRHYHASQCRRGDELVEGL